MDEQQFSEILDRYISGTANAEEQAWLESAYINLNKKSFSVYDDGFLDAQTDQIWHVVANATQPPKKLTGLMPLIYAAAALLIVSLIAVLVYNQSHPKSYLTNLPAAKDIKAGRDKAVLILANGKRIDLDKTGTGYLADQTGVKISKTADGQVVYNMPQQIEQVEKPEYNTIQTPAGGQYQVNLPDGTKVWLNASSSVTFTTSFEVERRVKLKGEAYFEVSKISVDGKRIPFVVETQNQKVEVLGTHFNVNAYSDERTTKTTLLEGSVKVNNDVLLQPNQQARGNGSDIKVLSVNAQNFIDWKNGDFILENNDFRSIMRKIARWYDVEIVYSDDAPQKLNLGGWISRSKNISSILGVMEQTGKVHFNIEGRRITVTR
ncbi:FecR family protein [Pedobacter frigidisoli]|uniref:FecR family protein n=1 Tax=Pedobacter frigidisoli TaxID=2530455 RepID=UPI00292EA38E|nr:FecR family protein [Pedobacter frigidisoli]